MACACEKVHMNSGERRDFFISYNRADVDHAAALDAALRREGFTTYYLPRDLPPGGNIAIWIDDALLNSSQTLALYSPDYVKETAVYSRAERYASWWKDPSGDKRKLIPVVLRETIFTPLLAAISRIEVLGLGAEEAAEAVVAALKRPGEACQRHAWQEGGP